MNASRSWATSSEPGLPRGQSGEIDFRPSICWTLVKPSSRTQAGYRLDTSEDLDRLPQGLFYRKRGFTLDVIGRVLAGPASDRRSMLVDQRELLMERAPCSYEIPARTCQGRGGSGPETRLTAL